jgi:hypothetical protein
MEDRDRKRSEKGSVIGQDAHVFMKKGVKNIVVCLAKFERTDVDAFTGRKLRIRSSFLFNVGSERDNKDRDYRTCFVSGHDNGRFVLRVLPFEEEGNIERT